MYMLAVLFKGLDVFCARELKKSRNQDCARFMGYAFSEHVNICRGGEQRRQTMIVLGTRVVSITTGHDKAAWR